MELIRKANIEVHRIPTEVRQNIIAMLEQGRDRDNSIMMECMQGFVFSLDEKLRATALENNGRVELYNSLIEFFS